MAKGGAQTAGATDSFGSGSGLSQWLFFLIASLGVTVLLAISWLIGLIDWGMYIVIGMLGVAMIAKGFMDARFLDRETKLASEQVRILETVDNFDAFLAKAPASVFRTHIQNLWTIARSHHEVNQDNLIEILSTRLLARNRIVELFASILTTLGLIGTIVGLIIMMNALQATMEDGGGGGGEMMTKLFGDDGPMRGLGAAFITTLLGAVLGGVILRVLTSIVDAGIMRYTAHLAELTEIYVLPHMRATARQSGSSPAPAAPAPRSTASNRADSADLDVEEATMVPGMTEAKAKAES